MKSRECARRPGSTCRRRAVGVNGRIWPGHGVPLGPESMLKSTGASAASASCAFQGKKSSRSLVDRAAASASRPGRGRRRRGGGRRRRTGPGEGRRRHASAGRSAGSGRNAADELRVDPEAVDDHEDPVLVAGLRLADVERAFEGPVERRRVDVERCRSSSCRGSSPGPRSRSWPRRRCRRSGRRRRRG